MPQIVRYLEGPAWIALAYAIGQAFGNAGVSVGLASFFFLAIGLLFSTTWCISESLIAMRRIQWIAGALVAALWVGQSLVRGVGTWKEDLAFAPAVISGAFAFASIARFVQRSFYPRS